MKIDGKLWINIDGLGIAGHGRIKLLELVQETGSIKKAAETIKMSYKAAWDSINILNQIYGTPLVERQTGGKGGGGTTLTKTGKDLIKTYNHYSRIHMMYLDAMINTNKITGRVDSALDTHVIVKTKGGDTLACIPLDEDLKSDEDVTVFISPRDIILVDNNSFTASARNILQASVVSVQANGIYTDAVLQTANGTELTVSITAKSAEKLGLNEGSTIFALFKTASALAMR